MSLNESTFTDCPALNAAVSEGSGDGDTTPHGNAVSGSPVVWLANTPPAQIIEARDRFGWPDRSDAQALHDCARRWLTEYHPELLDDDQETPVGSRPIALERAAQHLRAALASRVAWLRRTPQLLRHTAPQAVEASPS
jgi:hypothetical protein